MYFDSTPKTKRLDLYDREKELEELHTIDVPLVMILGLRRLGKTSLIKVFMNEVNYPTIFTDCRALKAQGFNVGTYNNHLIGELNRLSGKWKKSLVHFLKSIKGINVLGIEISSDLSKSPLSIIDTLESINLWAKNENTFVYMVYDEAQYLRFFKRRNGLDFPELSSFIYDNFSRIRVILTGSEVGILEDFVGLQNGQSPFYGRYIEKIELKKLEKQQSLDFLKKGFAQTKLSVQNYVLKMAVDSIDGVIGWLVFFGRTCMKKGIADRQAIEETIKEAEIIVKGEFSTLSKLSNRYLLVLKVIALGAKRWNEIKSAVEILGKSKVADKSISRAIEKLRDLNFIEHSFDESGKFYAITDPIVERAAREL